MTDLRAHMKEQTHREQAHRLEQSLTEAADAFASISPCPFAPGRPLHDAVHFDDLSPQCRARGLRNRRPRPFIAEMMQFVENRRLKDPSVSWVSLMDEWNAGHELHLYASTDSMREAYGNAVRRHRGTSAAHDICRSCVLEDLRRSQPRLHRHEHG